MPQDSQLALEERVTATLISFTAEDAVRITFRNSNHSQKWARTQSHCMHPHYLFLPCITLFVDKSCVSCTRAPGGSWQQWEIKHRDRSISAHKVPPSVFPGYTLVSSLDGCVVNSRQYFTNSCSEIAPPQIMKFRRGSQCFILTPFSACCPCFYAA